MRKLFLLVLFLCITAFGQDFPFSIKINDTQGAVLNKLKAKGWDAHISPSKTDLITFIPRDLTINGISYNDLGLVNFYNNRVMSVIIFSSSIDEVSDQFTNLKLTISFLKETYKMHTIYDGMISATRGGDIMDQLVYSLENANFNISVYSRYDEGNFNTMISFFFNKTIKEKQKDELNKNKLENSKTKDILK